MNADEISLITRASGGAPEAAGSWWAQEGRAAVEPQVIDDSVDPRIARIISEIPRRRRREHFYKVAA